MPHFVTASAPGRVCFAGEDIDWISGPAILGAIDLRLKFRVSTLVEHANSVLLISRHPFNVSQRVLISDIGHYSNHVMDYVHAAIKVLRDQGTEITPVKVEVSSNLPTQAGLSSSAAVSVAALTALSKYFNTGLSINQICRLAYSIESIELKTGAGQMDFYSCGMGGFLYINSATEPPCSIGKLCLPSDIAIIIADTHVPRLTADIIRAKRDRLEKFEPGILSYIKHTENVIEQIYMLLKKSEPDVNQLGSYISLCHTYLDKYMRVSTDLINACVDACKKHGALGAKLTGTGMGGCMFAIAPASSVLQIQQVLSGYPVTTYITTISSAGVRIEETGSLFDANES